MDVLASAFNDPTMLPLWGVLLFAASMYPFGMIFGCSVCCCPDAVTVTFSGLTKSSSHVTLASVSFQSCFGNYAAAQFTSPGGLPETNKGPLTALEILNPGQGYAKLARVAPTVTVTETQDSNGSGGTFTPTLAQQTDACGIPSWTIESVSVTGGSGYEDGEPLSITAAEGDTIEGEFIQILRPRATVRTGRVAPELALSVSSPNGSGASLTANLSQDNKAPGADGGDCWILSSVTIDNGGGGYVGVSPGYSYEADHVLVTLGDGGVQLAEASLEIITQNSEPTVSVSAASYWGNGALLSATMYQRQENTSTASGVWGVDAISVDSPGSDYTQFDEVVIEAAEGSLTGQSASAFVAEVDEDGGIVSVGIYDPGVFFKGGPIAYVNALESGVFYKLSGNPVSVEVQNGGKMYREDASLPPYIANVTATVSQQPPSAGTGASLKATVGDDPTSATFGTITNVSIENGGSGYLAWEYADCPVDMFNGKTFSLRRTSPGACKYTACVGGAVISVDPQSPFNTQEVSIAGSSEQCNILFYRPGGGGSLSFTVPELLGGTASVAPATKASLFTCETLAYATSVTVTIVAVDHIRKTTIRRISDGTAIRRGTEYWPGSLYAGTFELDFYGDALPILGRPGRLFRYYYGPSSLFCEPPYLQLVLLSEIQGVVSLPPVLAIQLMRATKFWNCGTGFEQHKEAADMTCTSGDAISTNDYGAATACPCDGGWFSTVEVAGATCGISSDETGPRETIVDSEQGSLLVSMGIAAYSNE